MAASGGLLKLLDAYIAIGGDAADFDKVVDQSEAKAKAAGGRLESAFSPRKVLGALGAAAGAVLGVTLGVAGQLDAAMRQLQADTGMTDTQAKAAEHSLAGMYKNNLQGFDEIGATMAVVHNELGLVGGAADAVTERFLKYATATGQSAAPAASDFAAILKAFNADASATPAIMDKLIASHQQYGTVITEDQAALVAMAPALDAMNMGVDDGIALLNLFQAAGISASKAPMALAKAMKELKPGENINTLIAQISAIEDPTLRAQKAIEIFGVKGGVQLAQAFKPGITSLSQFATTADENADATTKAAAAIESGFGEKFKLIMKNAVGTLAEFGTNFGDLIGIAQLFGPKFTTIILSGLGGLGTLIIPKIVSAILGATLPAAAAGTTVGAATGTAAGTAVGGAFSAAAVLAFPAFVGALIAAAGVAIALAVDDLFPGLAKTMHDDFFKGLDALRGSSSILDDTGNGFNSLGIRVDAAARTFGRIPPAVKGFADAATAGGGAVGELAAAAGRLNSGTLDLSRGALAASRSTTAMGSEASKAGPKVDVLADAADRAKSAMQVMGDKFKATWSELSAAASGAADDIYGPLTRASAKAANDREQVAQSAIISARNLTDAEAHQLDVQIIDQQAHIAALKKAKASASTIADAQEQLDALRTKASLKDVTAAERQAAEDRLLALRKEGLGIQIEMAGRGELTKAAYANLISTLQTQAASGNREIANSAALALAELAQLKAAASAIPNLPAWLTRSYSGSAAGGRASGGPVTAGYPYIVNENTPRSEWFVPETSGRILTADQAAGQGLGRGGAGGGDLTVNIYPGHDSSLQTARRFGQAVLDEVAYGLREQRARSAT